MAHYTLQEAAEAATLSPLSVKKYCQGFSDLVRGEDFYVHRYAATRRKLYITERGLYRLKLRAYRTFHPGNRIVAKPLEADDFLSLPQRYGGTSAGEFNQRLSNTALVVTRLYLLNPCAVPACPCMVHRLGLPQADALAKDRAELEARKAARRGGVGPRSRE